MQPLLTTYDERELVDSGLYTGEDPKLSVDDVLTARRDVSFRWTQCVRFARQVVADHLREIAVQSIGFLNENDTYADLTPAEERIAAGRDISLLRGMDGLRFSDYFTQAEQVEAKNHANWLVTPPTDAFIKAIRRGAYDEAVDNLTQLGFQTNTVAEVTLPWDADARDKTKNKKRVFDIGCALLAGAEVDEVDREFYTRECKRRRYRTPPPPEVRQGDAKGTQASQGTDDESVDDHVMSDDLADGSFRIAGGMGKHDGRLATNISTRSMAAGTSAGRNVAAADVGGGIGADDAGEANVGPDDDGDEDDSGDGDNSSELTDLDA